MFRSSPDDYKRVEVEIPWARVVEALDRAGMMIVHKAEPGKVSPPDNHERPRPR